MGETGPAGTSDILGHDRILTRLWAALDRDTLHQAYLFEGPEGLGKHRVALRLAMAANCERAGALRESGQRPPCGACRACTLIRRGDHPDVLIVGPDPERKTPTITVTQIREVVRKVGYHRYSGERRFVIVDPTEAMAAPSANALLKTLEEPPDGTGFILVAHSAAALLPTIVSRCQRVRFSAVGVDRLAEWLTERGLPDAPALARLSMGRPGAALTLSQGGLEARRKLRETVVGPVERGDLGELFELSRTLCTGDRQRWVARVQQVLALLEDGVRDASVLAAGGPVELLDPEAAQQAERWAHALWPTGIPPLVRALDEAREGLARNAQGRVVLDALFLRFAAELGAS